MPALALRSGDSPGLTGQMLSGGATARLRVLEAGRRLTHVRQVELAEAVGISEKTYRRMLAGTSPIRPHLVDRLERQLARLSAKVPLPELPEPIALACYRACIAHVAGHYGVVVEDVVAASPSREVAGTAEGRWYACAHARQAAIYLLVTAIGVQQRRVAELLALTPAAVCLALRSVEDRRDDPAVDRLLTAGERLLAGRG